MKYFFTLLVVLLLCATGANAQIISAGSGNWSAGATWVGGVVPGPTSNVIIANGHTVRIDGNITVASITVGQGTSGILTTDNIASRSITVTGDVTVASGASFVPTQISTTGSNTLGSTTVTVASTTGLVNGMLIGGIGIAAGTTITVVNATTITLSLAATSTNTGIVFTFGYDNTLSIAGNLTNNSTFDMSLGGSAAVCNVTFNKTTGNQTISGTGTTTRFRGVTLDKGAISNKVICSINVSMGGTNITFIAGTWEQPAGRLTTTSGSMAVGSLTVTSCALNIIGSGSLQIASNLNVYGTLLVNTTDSVIVGIGTNKIDLTYVAGAVATFTSGTVMVYGKISTNSLTAVTINGANIIVDPKGFATAVPPGTDYAFRVTTGGGTNPFTFTSGTITILNPNSTTGANPELAMSSSVAPNISGTARFVLGQGASTVPSAQGYRINLNSVALLNHLTINSGSVGVTLQSNVTVNGILTITSSGTLSGTGFRWRVPRCVFNGNVPQVTGTIMPDTVRTVVINNPAGVTSSQQLRIADTLFLLSGILTGPYTAGTTIVTDVETNPSQIPAEHSLSQNYPNPFNPSTLLTYQVARAGLVSVKVYDVLGREVATLVNEVKQAGTYSATWNAAGLGSGIYLCKLQAGPFTETKKLILMK